MSAEEDIGNNGKNGIQLTKFTTTNGNRVSDSPPPSYTDVQVEINDGKAAKKQ